MTYQEAGKDSQGNPIYNQNISLAPAQQQLLNTQNQTSLGLAGLQNQGLGAVQNLFNNLPSASQLTPGPINPGQTAQDALLSRLTPQLNQQQDRMNNQLANQGIQVGSEAYTNAQKDFGQQANDAYMQAALKGIDVGQQARQQGMNEQGFYSQMPINLLNAIRTGSQVQSPSFGATAPGANYSQALGQTYGSQLNAANASNAANSNFMGGLMNLGGAYLLGSDVSIKQDIIADGTHAGYPIYRFRYKPEYRNTWGHGVYVGVMAQDVLAIKPEAVHKHPDGYLMVNYGAL